MHGAQTQPRVRPDTSNKSHYWDSIWELRIGIRLLTFLALEIAGCNLHNPKDQSDAEAMTI